MVERTCPAKAISFQGKDSHEHFQFYFRQHWIRLVTPFLKTMVWNTLIFGTGYIMFYQVGITSDFARRSLLILLNLGFCITNIEFLHQFYRYFLYIIIVTDKKIHRIKKTLLCTNDHQSIDLWMIQDIDRSQHGLLQNLLKFGSMRLEAQETVVRLHFIPRVAKKYEELLRLKEMARNASRRLPSADRKRREEMMMQQAKESLLDSTRMQGSEVY